MKNIFIIIFLTFSSFASAATYYVSSLGNDAANGLSESTSWLTITKVNLFSFAPGDNVYFKRGDTWVETLIPHTSGNSSNRITFGAYGSGADPIISGFTTVSGWTETSVGSGIYSEAVTCESIPNMVTVDGVNTPIGRWPNTGWMTMDSHPSGSHTSFTDAALPSSPNLTGADVVIRGSSCIFDRKIISNHTSQTLIFASTTEEITNGAGYFIQNHISTLDHIGDWCYTGGILYMYFGTVDPTDYVVKVSVRNNLITLNAKSYITIENLNLIGANSNGVSLYGATYITIQHCNFDFGGSYAIQGMSGTNSNARIVSNVINHTNNNAIRFNVSSINTVVLYNTISNTGMIAGMGGSAYESYEAIICFGGGSRISYNRIVNTGYIGINVEGGNWEVSYNFVNYFCITKDDGAGIYSWRDFPISGKTIKYNIVLNGIGPSPEGWIEANPEATNGIYLDETYGVTISNNIVAHNYSGFGLFLHMSKNDIIEHNTFYDNFTGIRAFSGTGLIRNLNIQNNIFFAKTVKQYTISAVTKLAKSDLSLFGTIDYNYHIRPINNDKYIDAWYYAWGTSDFKLNLTEWRSAYGYDIHSSSTPITVSTTNDFHFIYNETSSTKIYTLSNSMVDVANVSYSNTVNLLPFTSLILIGGGTVTESGTGIELTGNNHTIKVYPNPVSDELIIEYEGNTKKTDFEILNSTGQSVFKGNLSEKTVVQTTNFSPGVYFLKLQNGKSFEFKKIVKL